LETLTINSIITDSPAPVAILDTEMCFIAHSNVWRETFATSSSSIIGKSYYDALPNSPDIFRKIHKDCLTGKSNQNSGKKFVYPNGSVRWLKWKINNWKNEDGEIGGLIIVQEDITETSRREELLQKAESVARIGGWEVDMATNVVYWTKVTREIHEVSEDYVPNLEEGINFYKAGKHREKITQLVSDSMSDGKPWDIELIIITAKGNELWIRSKGEVELVDGKCARIYGTFQDIDEKKKTELKFFEATERLEIATKGANVGIWDYDIVNNKLVWDDSMYLLYGIDKKDFKGEYEAWQSGLHPDDKKRGDEEITMAISGEKEFDTEFRVIWPNGEIRNIRAIAVTQRDSNGKAIKMTGTNWDITELKRTQLQLLRSEESFKGTFQNSVIGMALVALDGKFIEVNESLCTSLGYSPEELLQLTFTDITHPEDLQKDLASLDRIIKGEKESYQIEKRYYHKKGRVVHVILTVTAGMNIHGELSYFIGQIIDISPRIATEKKLTNLLNVTGEQNESLLNFAHIVSHNLRSHSTNLTMLTGFLGKENEVEEQKNLIRMLGGAAESLNETILHLNEVVQVKVGATEKMKRVNLYRAVKNVEKNLSVLIQEKNAECLVKIPEKLVIKGIPAYLDSIFLNLITNSIKYSSPDRRPIIKIESRQMRDKIILIFSDNGLGIDLNRHGKKLFGMYKTFHRNKDAKGIGLFITKNQIEAMNGRIEVASTVDEGTTFSLYFEANRTKKN